MERPTIGPYKSPMHSFPWHQCLGLTLVWNWEVGKTGLGSLHPLAPRSPHPSQATLPHACDLMTSNHPFCYSVLKSQQVPLSHPLPGKFLLILQNPAQTSPPLKDSSGTSLVAQWLRIRLPMQGTKFQSLVWEDPTRHGATKPMRHNYWAHAPQLLSPHATTTEGRMPRARVPQQEKTPLTATRESPRAAMKTQHSQK